MAETTVDIWIPHGFMEMPLTDIASRIGVAQEIVGEMRPSTMKSMAQAILPAAAALFTELAHRDTRYCGIGRHLTSDGKLITSCITVCVYETDGEKINPRLALTNLIESRAESGEKYDIEMVDVGSRPMMFAERVTELPTPELPGRPYVNNATATYQLEAVVPSNDGSALAAVELSTAAVDYGPEFRKMMVDMAQSVEFRAHSRSTPRLSSLDL
ncbi:hypothetical protein [Nocardia anaemiae]|uniref:hypothetical protein n=1 Tax=Nocardia anaemiae TaxID=263910 RepID=UPI0007A40414|nr:hypothetical protein [Nocardia anaemiae]